MKSSPQLTPALREKTKKFLSEYAKKEVIAIRRKAKKDGGKESSTGDSDMQIAVDESFELEEDPSAANAANGNDASFDIKFGDSDEDGSDDSGEEEPDKITTAEQPPTTTATTTPTTEIDPQNGMDMMQVSGDDLMYLDETFDFNPEWSLH
jgi:hypothetical protein